MKSLCTILLCCIVLFAQEPQIVVPASTSDDVDLLIGTWKALYIEEDGEQAPQDLLETIIFSFSKEKVVIQSSEKAIDVIYKLDSTKSPKHIDFIIQEQPAPILGIYNIDGDQLQMCFEAQSGKNIGRPTKFDASADSQYVIFKLERKKVVIETPAPQGNNTPIVTPETNTAVTTAISDDIALFIGTWKVLSITDDGNSVPQEVTANFIFIFSQEKAILQTEEKTVEILYKIDPTKSPKQIDFVIHEEPAPILGIYNMDGDQLQLCFQSRAGENIPRPTKLEAIEGSRHLLFKLERQKAATPVIEPNDSEQKKE